LGWPFQLSDLTSPAIAVHHANVTHGIDARGAFPAQRTAAARQAQARRGGRWCEPYRRRCFVPLLVPASACTVVPGDTRKGVVPNIHGHAVEEAGSDRFVPGVYVAGWIKHGPQGVLRTNTRCATDTVRQIVADAEAGLIPRVAADVPSIDALLAERRVRVTTWQDWQALDRVKQERGAVNDAYRGSDNAYITRTSRVDQMPADARCHRLAAASD
jgi:NADPH-dependent glutamate synthase beta subunit-like oxidoreductase